MGRVLINCIKRSRFMGREREREEGDTKRGTYNKIEEIAIQRHDNDHPINILPTA